MYTHYNEPLFDYIIIRKSNEFVNGHRIDYLFGVNYEDESKEVPCGIHRFGVSISCQFDYHKDSSISVFCKDSSQPNGRSKVFVSNSYTGLIVAMKDVK